jgi:hypothetical protein
MAPFDMVLITNTVSRVPLPFIKNRSTPASAAVIPNWLGLSLPVQAMVDLRMRMWRKQLHTLNHPPLLVIVAPILTRLEAGNDRMPCCRRMLGRMLTRRTVAATDVPTLRTPTEMKPSAFR